MAATSYKTIASAIYIMINQTILSFFIGISLFFHAYYKHFTVLVQKIDNRTVEFENFEDPPAVMQLKNEFHAKKIVLRDIIQFHIIVIE